ncbi:UDP-N-acetylglucosamine diphosphorylase/glucosamine-1-phosphate N-acetyltransferase, partial [Alphaproteobacteria bacterium]|nr:UDP-N-acetylglucosamine diphosphorylase/glucosamine-1-phosphate N-acetyltransferase [Alphaproteobacteria bacterium]
MQSSIPKPLHTISGKTMLQWVIDANIAAKITKYVIVIPKDNKEIEAVTKDLETVVQPIPLGTGDAVIQAK